MAQEMSGSRDTFILENYPSKITKAVVTEGLEMQHISKHSDDRYKLRFYTSKGAIEQEVSNGYFRFKPGRSFLIKYSIEYPHIFQIIKQVE